MLPRLTALAVLVLGAAGAGCTSFATVRSAQVQPGSSFTVQGSLSTPPGDETGWFWSLDCAEDCSHPIAGVDALYTYGSAGERPYSLSAGVNGLVPYVEGYTQLNGDSGRAYGVGARVGIPVTGWTSHQLYGRYDIGLGDGRRLLWNPGVFLHAGRSPNGESRGHFVAMVQAVGMEHRGPRRTVVPALALVVGQGRRERYGDEDSFTSVFGAASVSVTFHRPRAAPPAP
ncbi:MAG TPA: hypothetical protein VLK84_01015 [Longimicrobium sp.]|nr:hypothetical protein [Longimicrobium sp.]